MEWRPSQEEVPDDVVIEAEIQKAFVRGESDYEAVHPPRRRAPGAFVDDPRRGRGQGRQQQPKRHRGACGSSSPPAAAEASGSSSSSGPSSSSS
eukprot:4482621-Lingulodinium_polyedra.AAC.1